MNRRRFVSVNLVGVGIGLVGCLSSGANQGPAPSIGWKSSEGHTEAMGGDNLAIFEHDSGDALDTSESTIRPIHDDNDHNIDREVSFMNHEPGNIYREGDVLRIVIPESEPHPEFGESFAIEWRSDDTEWYTIAEHLWGQNYRPDVDCGKNTERNRCRGH